MPVFSLKYSAVICDSLMSFNFCDPPDLALDLPEFLYNFPVRGHGLFKQVF